MYITIASYALADILKALYLSGITKFSITKEDNDLVLVISEKDLFNYRVHMDCECTTNE